jgi:opacity protein-like surface antigen
MKAKLSGLTLSIALVTGAAGSAVAGGDVIYQGVKDPGAAIPVPAPIPVMIYEPSYYVRFDVGASWLSDGTLDEHGSGMETRAIDDVDTMEFGSIGAGRYITPSIRAEIAVDLMTKASLDRGQENFNEVFYEHLPDRSTDTVTYDVVRQEKIKFEQDVAMLSLYYDFRNSSRFTPYVGGGIGVTYRQLTRTSSEVAVCSHLENDADAGRDCGDANPFSSIWGQREETVKRWDFAAAAMAGVSYEITDDIIWDTSYRYLWQSGTMAISMPTLAGTSTVEMKDVGQHQLRTGIRLNLN